MEHKTIQSILFAVGIIFALISVFIILFANDGFLPLSITFLIVGIILISTSPRLAKRMKS